MTYDELVRAAYADYNRRDFDATVARFTPDVRWQVPVNPPVVGRAAVQAFFSGLAEMVAAHEIVVNEIVEQDDRLDAHVTHRFTTHDGRTTEFKAVHAWTRQGDLLSKLDEVADTLAFAVMTGQVPAPAAA
jgi:ketosteroid isomerase-like protein